MLPTRLEVDILHWENMSISAKAERVMALAEGYILTGKDVAILHPLQAKQFYRHGFHSWSLTSWWKLANPPVVPQPAERWPMADDVALLHHQTMTQRPISHTVGAIEEHPGSVLLLGALGPSAWVEAGTDVLQGKYLHDSGDWFVGYGEERTVFHYYAMLLSQRLGRRGAGKPPRVWCSWYGLYQNISASILLGILQGLKGLPLDVFQIDDGWQKAIGDWQANAQFPGGMASLAEQARHVGLRAGLWLAPFLVNPQAPIFREHPEWLLREANGQLVSAGRNWGDWAYVLDTTHPDVQDWLTKLVSTIRGWGYDYLKFDFLYAAALPGKRHQDMSGEQAYRQALSLLRKAAGEEAYILACGAPVTASLGIADGIRIGPDVGPYWDNTEVSSYLHNYACPGALNALRTSVHRLWLRPLIHIDPDVVYFRKCFNLLQPAECQYLRDLAIITNFRGTSDLPSWLDAEERQALTTFFQANLGIEQRDRYRFDIEGRQVDFSFVALPFGCFGKPTDLP